MNLIFAVMAIISLIVMTVIDPENAYSATVSYTHLTLPTKLEV